MFLLKMGSVVPLSLAINQSVDRGSSRLLQRLSRRRMTLTREMSSNQQVPGKVSVRHIAGRLGKAEAHARPSVKPQD